jgi:hypothetical protein
LADVVGQMLSSGVRAPIGIEVWDQQLLDQGPKAAAGELYRSVTSFLNSVGP